VKVFAQKTVLWKSTFAPYFSAFSTASNSRKRRRSASFLGLRAQPGDDRPGFHNSYALRNWLSLYQHKVQTGLFVSPARARTEKRDVQAFQQCYGELEQALQQANLLILALHTMIDVAEQELQVPI
jgi:hypothetical protein